MQEKLNRLGNAIEEAFKAIESKKVASEPAELDMKKLRRMRKRDI